MLHLHIVVLLALLALALLIGIPLLVKSSKIENDRSSTLDADRYAIPGGISILLAFVFVLCIVVSLFPFSPKYWFLHEYTGTVETIDTLSAVSDQGSKSQLVSDFVVTLDNSDEIFLSTDPRVRTYEEGDDISLRCGFEWIYGSAEKLNCQLSK